MVRFRRMKALAVLLSICMLLGVINTKAYARNDMTVLDNNKEEAIIHSYGMEGAETVSGSAIYANAISVYYVDANYTEGDGDGSIEKPYSTIQDAVSAIDKGMKKGVLYICSDLVINSTISINNEVTILNYGSEPHTIRSNSASYILDVSNTGSLTLGAEGEGNDESPKLLITGEPFRFISNSGILKIYPGIKIFVNEEDDSDHCALYNGGTTYMYGGTITGFKHMLYSAIDNYGTFIMEGGSISKCMGSTAGALYNDNNGTFIMKGGRIEENSSFNGVAIDCEGAIHLSDSASIPQKNDGSNKLLLSEKAFIKIENDLSSSEKIMLALKKCFPRRETLQGDETVIRNNYQKFIIDPTVTDYYLAEDGTLKYIGLVMDFYVDEKNGDDGNTGTKDSPFATLVKAVDTIGSGIGTVHICSDINLKERIDISGAIKLINEGEPYTILRDPSYSGNMFSVTGQLELGNSELDGGPEVRLLTINGNKEKMSYSSSIIENRGRVILHNGIVLEDNISNKGGAIENFGHHEDGTLFMYGGVIQNNYVSRDGGGIDNFFGQVTILGGSIRNNIAEQGCGGGINHSEGGFTTISGGNIHDNTAIRGGGIASDGSINISSGKIYNNKAELGGGLSSYTSHINMSGGEVFGNTGLDEKGTTVGNGIELDCSLLTISGNASIASDNEIALYDEAYYPYDKATVVVGGQLSEDMPVISLAIYNYENRYPDKNYYYYFYTIGKQVLKPADGYTLTAQDISRFQMLDSNYGINNHGRIAQGISDSWFTLTGIDNIIYSGSEIKPAVVGVNGTTSLEEERDYQVRYTNNINPGTATVYIYGMDNYGGTVIKTFTIKNAITPKPTPEPSYTPPSGGGAAIEGPTPTPTPTPVPTGTQLDSDRIRDARESGTDLNISVKDNDGKERYTWSFKGSDLAASDKKIEDLDLSLSIQRVEENKDLAKLLGNSHTGTNNQGGLLINFSHDGDLPSQASIRMYVGNMGYSEGDRLYLYHYNSESGKLETLPYSSNYVVDRDGYITIKVVYCSQYVLLPKQAKEEIITSLRNQISVEPKKVTLKPGSNKNKTAVIQVNLPKTLEQVKDLKDKTSGSAIGAVRITYKSSNSKVASVDSKGKITAKKAGKAVITVKTTLYSGKTKTFKVSVIVK